MGAISHFWRLDLGTFSGWEMIIGSPFFLRLMFSLSVQLELSNGGLVSMESARSMAQLNLPCVMLALFSFLVLGLGNNFRLGNDYWDSV